MTAQEAREKTRIALQDELKLIYSLIEQRIAIGSFVLDFKPSDDAFKVLLEQGYSWLRKRDDGIVRTYIWWGENPYETK